MSRDDHENHENRRKPPVTGRVVGVRVLVGVLLVAPFVVYLSVPSYSRIEPRLGGFPFFYWWQLVWVILTGTFIWIAFLLTRGTQASGGDQATPGPADDEEDRS